MSLIMALWNRVTKLGEKVALKRAMARHRKQLKEKRDELIKVMECERDQNSKGLSEATAESLVGPIREAIEEGNKEEFLRLRDRQVASIKDFWAAEFHEAELKRTLNEINEELEK